MQALYQLTNVMRTVMVKQDTLSHVLFPTTGKNPVLNENTLLLIQFSSCNNVGHKHLPNIWSTE